MLLAGYFSIDKTTISSESEMVVFTFKFDSALLSGDQAPVLGITTTLVSFWNFCEKQVDAGISIKSKNDRTD
jgi:hypothetical protein